MHEAVVEVVAVLHLASQHLTGMATSTTEVNKVLNSQNRLQGHKGRKRGVVGVPALKQGVPADRVSGRLSAGGEPQHPQEDRAATRWLEEVDYLRVAVSVPQSKKQQEVQGTSGAKRRGR